MSSGRFAYYGIQRNDTTNDSILLDTSDSNDKDGTDEARIQVHSSLPYSFYSILKHHCQMS